MDERQKIVPREKNKTMLVRGAAVAGVFLIAASSYFYFSASGRNFLQNARAAFMASVADTFSGGAGGGVATEISMDDGDPSSSAEFFGDAGVDPGAEADVPASAAQAAPEKTPPAAPAQKNSAGSSVAAPASAVGTESFSDSAPTASTSAAQEISPSVPVPECNVADAADPSEEIILNEIAWMGSVAADGETAAHASDREWIELKNNSGGDVDLSGWQILDAAGNLKITFGAGDHLAAGSFYLLARGANTFFAVPVDKIYSGALPNAGDSLALFDAQCATIDLLDASAAWPGGDNVTKQTLERDADGVGWHTSAAPGGTPRAENSLPVAAVPPPAGPALSTVSVAIEGDSAGIVSSVPAGINCGPECSAGYASGTTLTLTAIPGQDDTFGGWSGACSGLGTCAFSVDGPATVGADFIAAAAPVGDSSATGDFAATVATATDQGEGSGTALQSAPPPAPASGGLVDHLVIAEVQIAGAITSSNDLVEIENPTTAPVDVSGWKLHKKSSTGADYSLRTFPDGSVVAAGGMFTWANSEDGFSASVNADVSSTETLSPDNSVALFDGAGAIVDEVAWGTGVNQYVEASAYPVDPAAGQMLVRKTANGAVVDTDDNAEDFTLQ